MIRSLALGILAALVLQIISGCCHNCHLTSTGEGDQHKYAVLASTETPTPRADRPTGKAIPNNDDFWNDLVSTYCTLRNHGFTDENIFVLYGEGKDYKGANHPSYKCCYCEEQVKKITDFSINQRVDNICNVLCCLSSGHPATTAGDQCECLASGTTGAGGFSCSDQGVPKLKTDDILVTWIKGHGSSINCETALTMQPMQGSGLSDQQLASLLKGLPVENRLMLFETCDSAGWIDNLKDLRTTIVATPGGRTSDSNCVETSYPGPYMEEIRNKADSMVVFHSRFTHWINASYSQRDPGTSQLKADTNSNNLVSFQESYNTVNTEIQKENSDHSKFYGDLNPSISGPQNIRSCYYLRQPLPVRKNSVFAKDHDNDDGTVPSTTEGSDSLHSPDLWVGNDTDCKTGHQRPDSGKANTICARVHNIGCSSQPASVQASFYLVEMESPNSCKAPKKEDVIGISSPVSLAFGSSAVVPYVWTVDKKLADQERCLIAAFSTVDDSFTEDTRAVDDDNIVQRKIRIR